MSEKIQFFSKFYSMALRNIEMYRSSRSVAEELEYLYEENVKWHKENDERVYRESLTLEQLYRLDY